jgi:hypothetical protein
MRILGKVRDSCNSSLRPTSVLSASLRFEQKLRFLDEIPQSEPLIHGNQRFGDGTEPFAASTEPLGASTESLGVSTESFGASTELIGGNNFRVSWLNLSFPRGILPQNSENRGF